MMQYVIKQKRCRQMALKAKKSDETFFEKNYFPLLAKTVSVLVSVLASVLANLPHFFRHFEMFNCMACYWTVGGISVIFFGTKICSAGGGYPLYDRFRLQTEC